MAVSPLGPPLEPGAFKQLLAPSFPGSRLGDRIIRMLRWWPQRPPTFLLNGEIALTFSAHPKFSQDLRNLLRRLADRPLTLGDLVTETADRGVVLMIGLLVLPFLLPMPPGLTTILGGGSLLLSLQLIFGKNVPWLPPRIARFRFPQRLAKQVLNNLHRFTRLLETHTRPRWLSLAQHPLAQRINGLCMAWLALLLMSPVPFTNPIPTVGILLFVVAMLERDGLLLCIAYGMTGLITAMVGIIAFLVWQSPDWLPQIFS
ncbi:exopolysaccharide biosynthesis protein [Lyngbya confervoides]|uniref:Exopolysaccharide biosynthesis protein n=1 Tax=Lyngbya confervoides BDU141951 TaxID=1574623 RepID=A0ABD4SZT5_9CYAN|nr:exopolysaccharide biosynthesis protein [Lyngbya confervoides]MCM1981671.1 exopolysaccharide biosynthesis protein [Lyngbya confervoides BDU141951]